MSSADIQQLDPVQDVTVESIIAQDAPGKANKESADSLTASLEGMGSEDLLELIEEAYREDPNANSLVLEKASAILEERGQGKNAKERLKAVQSESYRNLLGEFLGGQLHDVVADHTAVGDLQKYGEEALDGALDALVGEIDGLGLDQDGEKALTKLSQALQKTAQEAGARYLKSEGGQELLAKISHWVEENPGWVVTAAVLAAAGAVAADLDIPELKTKFKIAEGLTTEVAASLGSLRNIGFEAARANVEFVRGNLKLKAGVEHNHEDGQQQYQFGAFYGTQHNNVEANGLLDYEGNFQLNLGTDWRRELFRGSADAGHNFGTEMGNAEIDLRYGDQQEFFRLGSDLDYNNNNGDFGLGLGAGFRRSIFEDQGLEQYLHGNVAHRDDRTVADFGTVSIYGNYTMTDFLRSQSDEMVQRHQQFTYQDEQFFAQVNAIDQGNDMDVDAVSAEFGLRPSEFAKMTLRLGQDLDGGSKLGAGLDYKDDELEAMVAGEIDLDSGQLQDFSARLGFRDPLEFEQFAVHFSHSVGMSEVSETELGGMFEAELGKFLVRGSASTKLYGEGGSTVDVGAQAGLHAARFLNPDLALIGGGSFMHNMMRDDQTRWVPEIGIQYKNIPVTVGWDFDNEAALIRLTLPFGR